ncbi:ShKT domain-containing protein, partial [Meloidogyne graminicola]
EQKFIPLLINGKRLIDIQPNNHFIKIIANNLTKLNEILKEKKQQIHEKIKNNKEGNISSFLTTSSGREAKQLENKQEKQLEEKEEKKNKLINLNKPLILENNLNKLEEKKKLQTLNVLNNDKKEKEEREKNKKDESNNNNNKNKVKTTEKKQKFPESLPEELISIKNKKKQENEERGKEKE